MNYKISWLRKTHFLVVNSQKKNLVPDFFPSQFQKNVIITELPLYLENRGNKEKSLTLKIDQKLKEFIKIDWLAIATQRISCQCWKQIVGNSGLESHVCDFSTNSPKSVSHSSDYCWILWSLKFLTAKFRKTLDCWFRIFEFSDLTLISKN